MKAFLLSIAFSIAAYNSVISQEQNNWYQPNPVDSQLETANSHASEGNYEHALEALNTAITADPQNVRAFKIRGNIHYQMGNYQLALKDFNQLITLVPNSAMPYIYRSIIQHKLGNQDAAKQDIDAALKISPDDEFAKVVKKEVYNEKPKKLPYVTKKKSS